QAFYLHPRIRRDDSRTAHISKAFASAFENTRANVAPLILIIHCNKIGRGIPVLMLNRVEKIFGVTPYLSLRLPESDEIEPYAKSDGQPSIKACTKRNQQTPYPFRHLRRPRQ